MIQWSITAESQICVNLISVIPYRTSTVKRNVYFTKIKFLSNDDLTFYSIVAKAETLFRSIVYLYRDFYGIIVT